MYGYHFSFHLGVFQGIESTRNVKCTKQRLSSSKDSKSMDETGIDDIYDTDTAIEKRLTTTIHFGTLIRIVTERDEKDGKPFQLDNSML